MLFSAATRCGLMEADVLAFCRRVPFRFSAATRCGLMEASAWNDITPRHRACFPQRHAAASWKLTRKWLKSACALTFSAATRCGLMEAGWHSQTGSPLRAFSAATRCGLMEAFADGVLDANDVTFSAATRCGLMEAPAARRAPQTRRPAFSAATRCGLMEAPLRRAARRRIRRFPQRHAAASWKRQAALGGDRRGEGRFPQRHAAASWKRGRLGGSGAPHGEFSAATRCGLMEAALGRATSVRPARVFRSDTLRPHGSMRASS